MTLFCLNIKMVCTVLIRYSTDSKGRPVQKAVIYTKEEHNISLKRIDGDAVYVIRRLRETGFDAYLVGGAVRDLIVGRTPKDFDIVTDATPSRVKRIFHNSRIIGRRFRLVHVIFGQKIFEVSTFRSICEGSVGNVFGTMDEDVQRRDFSLNALYYDPVKEQVIDYVNGVNDIKKGVVRPVIPLDRIFIEDPVRMIRAVKYSATTGCVLPWKLKRKILKSADLLSPVSPSRLTEETLKIINSGHSYAIVSGLMESGLYLYLQPAATNLMLEDKKFCASYMDSLKDLDSHVSSCPDSRLGERLYFILKDFVASLTDWDAEVKGGSANADLYKMTWARCRNFILPMNPQRTELDFAIKKILDGYGIHIKQAKRKTRIVLPPEED